MPNNTTIEMAVTGPAEVLDLFIASHIVPVPEEQQSAWAPEPYHFDFNTIIPMPMSLRSDDTIEGFAERSKWSEEKRAAYNKEQEIKAAANEKKYGHGGWYNWSVANWGVKWNSYDNNINTDFVPFNGGGSIMVNFSTAWTIPEKIFLELSELYPELVFDVECLEEGGEFAGRIVYENGEADETDLHYDIESWREQASRMFDWEFDDDGNVI